MEGKATYRYVFLRMVREVEMSRDWFRAAFLFLGVILVRNMRRINSMNSSINSEVNSDKTLLSTNNSFLNDTLDGYNSRLTEDAIFSVLPYFHVSSLPTVHINPPSLLMKDSWSVYLISSGQFSLI